jgi:hypothetical protein
MLTNQHVRMIAPNNAVQCHTLKLDVFNVRPGPILEGLRVFVGDPSAVEFDAGGFNGRATARIANELDNVASRQKGGRQPDRWLKESGP